MIRHDNIAKYSGVSIGEIVKPFVDGVVSIGESKKRFPRKAGEGDKIDVALGVVSLQPYRHTLKIYYNRFEALTPGVSPQGYTHKAICEDPRADSQ